FDLLLLDPPWPNRSASRASPYNIETSATSIFSLLLKLDLDAVIAPDALVAVWITHKPAVRAVAMKWASSWGGVLVEEWIWGKITKDGAPIIEMEEAQGEARGGGNGRKPYEILLLFRAPSSGSLEPAYALQAEEQTNSWNVQSQAQDGLKRRVILAVPDLHSRKPCLKDLLEELKSRCSVKALEVFARCTVSGWWSWGNEACLFNWEGAFGRVDGEGNDREVPRKE
ncbi:MT-A70, partial [Aulographum hederae CBS 113979]